VPKDNTTIEPTGNFGFCRKTSYNKKLIDHFLIGPKSSLFLDGDLIDW